MSIRTQLILRLTIVSILLVGTTAWLGYRDVGEETRELFDAQLARSARLILSLVQAQNGVSGFSKIQEYLDENDFSATGRSMDATGPQWQDGHIYETRLAFQVWDNEGNLLVKSNNAPLQPLMTGNSGYSNIVVDDYDWRTFSLQSHDRQYRCITAERIDVRNDLIRKISNDLFYMFIILIPALFLVVLLSSYQVLRPLQQLATQISRRGGDNLDLITEQNDYAEIATIKNALNQLLQRLDDTLEREKRITSDAAHELRTPLAAIRLHTELAKNAKNRQQQNESLDQVLHGVDRTTHLVEQLLTLARLEPELIARDFSKVSLEKLIIEESSLLSPLALDRGIDISFDEAGPGFISGHEPSLRLMIRNLLTNAITYTPSGGKVTIKLLQKGRQISLIIEDNGPGIPKADRERVSERFYRGDNHQLPGCGIGLSIVDRVVQIHHGEFSLLDADSGQGLKVVVRFTSPGE